MRSLPPLASDRPVASRPGLTLGVALARVRGLASTIHRDTDARVARARLDMAMRLLVAVRESFDASSVDPALEPLVAASLDAVDEVSAALDAAAVHVSELERKPMR